MLAEDDEYFNFISLSLVVYLVVVSMKTTCCLSCQILAKIVNVSSGSSSSTELLVSSSLSLAFLLILSYLACSDSGLLLTLTTLLLVP